MFHSTHYIAVTDNENYLNETEFSMIDSIVITASIIVSVASVLFF